MTAAEALIRCALDYAAANPDDPEVIAIHAAIASLTEQG